MIYLAFWSFILLSLLFVTITKGCMFKFEHANKLTMRWDQEKQPRYRKNCECGTHILDSSATTPPPWNVYIHTKLPDSSSVKTCTGTLVNYNTIVTSHKCLQLDNQSMRLVDLLKFTNGIRSIARTEDITVTTTRDVASATQTFSVEKIVLNPKFALTSELQRTNSSVKLEDDLVLIKISTDLSDIPELQLICVQPYNDKLVDVHETGYFYAAMDAKTEDVHIIEGEVKKQVKCQEDSVPNKIYCLRHPIDGSNRNPGGPLIVTSGDRSFLLGISTEIPSVSSTSTSGQEASLGLSSTYFTAIGPLVRFIEYFASQDGSKWCSTPKFKLNGNHDPEQETGEPSGENVKGKATRAPWPWENLQQPIVRDEVLNCACGQSNYKIMGRVVGGVEATPREFGWMALLHLFPQGRKGRASFCGGSVITDRIILTAAHCVVVDAWLFSGNKEVSIAPENIDVTLNAHLRNGDPKAVNKEVEAVLFHPEYLTARKAYPEYFDTDIALLVLKERLDFGADDPKIRPICLHKSGEYEQVVGRSAWVVGWGLTDPKDTSSAAEKLQKLQVPIAELSYCGNVARTKVTVYFLCAGTLNMYKDAARGDSGGPLQIEDKNNSQWYQVGAVSWGEDVFKDGKTLTAALYADVQKLITFVDYHARRVGAKWCKAKKKDEQKTN